MATLKRQISSVHNLQSTLDINGTNIANEITRATAAEGTISTNLNNEVNRATTVEGTLADLTTSVKTSLVLAINSEVSRASGVEGNLSSLSTTDKTNLVNAINEEVARAKSVEGSLSSLSTTDKTSLVSAINEVMNGISSIASGLVYKGVFDPNGSLPAEIKIGDFYKVSVAGTVGGVDLQVGDMIIANAHKSSSISISDFDKIDNTEDPTNLQESDISNNTDFTVDGAKLTTRSIIKGLADTKLSKSSNLSDLADTSVARTNLDVYSKSEVTAAISAQSNISKNVSGVIATDKVTFSDAPIGGINGVAFGVVRIFGVVDGNSSIYDECEITIDGTDATGKTFIINGDVAGMYNGKTAKAFIVTKA